MKSNNKILKNINIEGLQLIGRGANGSVYRLDEDKIIKIYNNSSLERIEREKDAARKALIHDIPTAISYQIAEIGDKYGIIYECIEGDTLGQFIEKNPDQLNDAAKQMSELLKKLHSTTIESGILPDARINLRVWADIAEKSGYYSQEVITKLRNLIDSIPYRNTFVHGDFHPGNIMISNGELLLIDMTDASVGNPLVDLLGSYQIMKLVAQRPGGANRYSGLSNEKSNFLWDIFIQEYTGITNKEELIALERRLKFYALIRSLPGITFSELIPKDKIPYLAEKISNVFLKEYDVFIQENDKIKSKELCNDELSL